MSCPSSIVPGFVNDEGMLILEGGVSNKIEDLITKPMRLETTAIEDKHELYNKLNDIRRVLHQSRMSSRPPTRKYFGESPANTGGYWNVTVGSDAHPSPVMIEQVQDFLDNKANIITERLEIPPIRGVRFRDKEAGKNTVASMGDGVLSIYTNQRVDHVHRQGITFGGKRAYAEVMSLRNRWRDMMNSQEYSQQPDTKLAESHMDTFLDLSRLALAHSRRSEAKDNITAYNNRTNLPWVVEEYYSDPADRFLSTLFHEMGHHIHQQIGQSEGAHDNPVDFRLGYHMEDALRLTRSSSIIPARITSHKLGFYSRPDPFDTSTVPAFGGSISNLSAGDLYFDIGSNLVLSNYSIKHPRAGMEAFAENFSYWAMDKLNGVRPLGRVEDVLPGFSVFMDNLFKEGENAIATYNVSSPSTGSGMEADEYGNIDLPFMELRRLEEDGTLLRVPEE